MYHSRTSQDPGGPPERPRLTVRHWIIVAGALAAALVGSFAIVLLIGALIS